MTRMGHFYYFVTSNSKENKFMDKKLIFRKKYIYSLHRDNEKDHKLGRPAILLNYRKKESLI